ncbi:MAG: hypothetical protein K9G46_03710 [Flavobacteriales bacterium]|jgi:hypothetical protein|nr:hypothetical protein [Flavobacteriales bacterium]
MKSLLLISLSVLLSVCNSKTDSSATEEAEGVPAPTEVNASNVTEENAIISTEEPVIDQAVDAAESKPASTKPKYEGKMPDTTVKKIIEHGAPDKAHNDSVKAAKTKGKF